MTTPALALDIPPSPAPMLPSAPPPDDVASFQPFAAVADAAAVAFALRPETIHETMIALIRRGVVHVRFPGREGISAAPPIEHGSRRSSARAFDRVTGEWGDLAAVLVDGAAVRSALAERWLARAPFRPATAEQLTDADAWHAWQDAGWRLVAAVPPMSPPLSVARAQQFVAHAVLLNLTPLARLHLAPLAALPDGAVVAGWQDDGAAVPEARGGVILTRPAAAGARWSLLGTDAPLFVHLPSLAALLLDVVEGRRARPSASIFARLPDGLA